MCVGGGGEAEREGGREVGREREGARAKGEDKYGNEIIM